MLVSISGSQSCGKSTLLSVMKEQHNIKTIDRKTSRSILSDWNVTLEEVNENNDLTIRFQDEILKRKYEDEQHAFGYQKNELFFTERTYADLFSYALISLGKNNAYSNWLNEYYKKCVKLQQLYHHIFYLKAGHFAVEHDGIRGSGIHYSRMVDIVMFDLTDQMSLPSKISVIDTPCLEQRVAIITSQMNVT